MVVAARELSELVAAVVCLSVVVVDLAVVVLLVVASVVSVFFSVVASVVAVVVTREVVAVLDEGASSAQPTRHIAAAMIMITRAKYFFITVTSMTIYTYGRIKRMKYI